MTLTWLDSVSLKMQNVKFKIQNPKFKMQNAKCKMQNVKCKKQNTKRKMENRKYKSQNAKHEMQIRHSLDFLTSSSSLPLSSLEIADTEGTVVLSQIPSLINRSLHIKTSAVIMIVMVMVMMMTMTIPFLKRSD